MQPSKHWRSPGGGRSCGWCGSASCRRPSIADHFGDVTRSAISQHLGVLKEAGLVSERRDGTRRLYRARQDEMRSSASSSTTTGPPASNGCVTSPRPPNETKEPLMAELVREIVIDATPETIWPFLVEPEQARPVARHRRRDRPASRRHLPGARRRSAPVRRRVRRGGAAGEGRLHVRVGRAGSPDPARLHDRRDRAASRKGRRRACASSTAAFPPTRSRTTATVGSTTSSGSRSRRPAATPGPTSRRGLTGRPLTIAHDRMKESAMKTPPIVSRRGVGRRARAAAREGEGADPRP